jgi:hypothetical protein
MKNLALIAALLALASSANATVTCKPDGGSTTFAGVTGSCQTYNCSDGSTYHNWTGTTDPSIPSGVNTPGRCNIISTNPGGGGPKAAPGASKKKNSKAPAKKS